MSGFNEKTNENSFLKWLDNLGWTVYGGENHHGSGGPLVNDKYGRDTDEPILWDEVRNQLIKLNPKVSPDNVDSVITGIKGDFAKGRTLLETNKKAHELLTTGRQTTLQQPNKEPITANVKLVDYEHPGRNSLIAANQVRFRTNGKTIRPDVTLFLNGFPIVQVELKATSQGNQIGHAIRDLQTYESGAPEAFHTALFNMAASTHKSRIGAVGAGFEGYQPWERAPPEYTTSDDFEGFKQTTHATLNPSTFLNILKNYVFFEEGGGGITKITPRYMQYYATENLLDRVKSGVESGKTTHATRGLIWHTQGSGKSYTMIYASDRLIEAGWFPSPQILILVDTDDLREQLTNTLSNIGYSHRFDVAESMEHLYDMLESGTSGIILSTIQMFEEASTNIQGNPNTVIMSDEAHRFMEKSLGSRLEGALPSAHHFGFTGTPVSARVRNTFQHYSDDSQSNGGKAYLDRYSIQQGIDDGVILPVHFEVRKDIQWKLDEISMDEEFDELTADLSDEEKSEILRNNITSNQLSEIPERVSALSENIYEHYQEKLAPNEWKALVVTPSRHAADMYGEELRAHFDDPNDVRVIISQDRDDKMHSPGIVDEHNQNQVINAFKKEGSPKVLVVCDMLLTGFDAPVLKAMYLDRNLKDHNLLQAIARVNRPEENKHNGLIVDYRGALSNLEDALQFDDEVVDEEIAAEESDLLREFEEILKEVKRMFSGSIEIDGQEDITSLVSEITKRSEEFKDKVERLQNIYESLAPHGGLVEYEDNYEDINKIRLELKSIEKTGGSGPIVTGTDWGQKTLDLVKKTTNIDLVEEKYPEFELDSSSLEEISDVPDDIKIVKIGKGLKEIVERNRQNNPRYDQLSERLQEVLEKWRNDMLSAEAALSTLEEIEAHAREIESQRGDPDLGNAEYAIYLTITDQYDDIVPSESEAKLIAKEIEKQFQDTVNRDFLGWKTDTDTHKEIRQAIIAALQETNMGLYDEEFVKQCLQYLVENHN